MITVKNMITQDTYNFLDTTTPQDAIISAYANEMKDGNTWTWGKYYKDIQAGNWHYFIGDLAVRYRLLEIGLTGKL